MSTRPSRNAAAPRPSANPFYCHTCGRVISPRKSHTTQPTPQRYCSDRCRREKPRPGPSTEIEIEQAFVRLLGDGQGRRIISCEEVERVIFAMAARGTEDGDEGRVSVDANVQGEDGQSSVEEEEEEEADDGDDGGVRLLSNMEPPAATTVATMKPKGERRHDTTPREWGMQKAREREMVRRAARRGVAFGFEMEEGKRRRVEAVQGGRVVESSFAKGEWGVRWRE